MENKNYSNENYNEDLKLANFVFNKHFCNYENIKDDLIQVALFALWKGRKYFDCYKATYSTWACKICKNEMSKFIYKELCHLDNYSLNEKIGIDNNDELETCIKEKSFSFYDIDELIVISTAIKKYLKNIHNKKVIINIEQLLLKGFSVSEISNLIGCSHQYVSNIKALFKRELKEILDKELNK